jgi:hypothetical protein
MTDVRRLRTWGSILVGALLCMLVGCTTEEQDGDTFIYKYELWIPAAIFAGGIAAVPIGWMLRNKSARFGWGLLILGPVAALVFAPGLWLDKVTINDKQFTLRTGMWFMPTEHVVNLDNVGTIEHVTEETRGRRGRKNINHYLIFHPRTGAAGEKVPYGDLMQDKAIDKVIQIAVKRGINLVDNTPGK